MACTSVPDGEAAPRSRPDAPPSAPGTAAPPTTSSTSTASTPGEVGALVDRLEVRSGESETDLPYRRDEFGDDWAYDPASGCNTRERVLIEESLVAPTVDDRCRSTDGRWRSIYDGVVTDDPADLEIDHLVPLADAWRSGAADWSPERRAAFHDDLTDPASLVAVTSRTNRSKGDSPPDRWLPPDRGAWCEYARSWVAVKAAWGLSVTPAEKSTLVAVLGGCP